MLVARMSALPNRGGVWMGRKTCLRFGWAMLNGIWLGCHLLVHTVRDRILHHRNHCCSVARFTHATYCRSGSTKWKIFHFSRRATLHAARKDDGSRTRCLRETQPTRQCSCLQAAFQMGVVFEDKVHSSEPVHLSEDNPTYRYLALSTTLYQEGHVLLDIPIMLDSFVHKVRHARLPCDCTRNKAHPIPRTCAHNSVVWSDVSLSAVPMLTHKNVTFCVRDVSDVLLGAAFHDAAPDANRDSARALHPDQSDSG